MAIVVTVTSPAPTGSDCRILDFLLNAVPNTAGNPPAQFTAHDSNLTLGSEIDLIIESLDADPFTYSGGAVVGGTVDRILIKSSIDGVTRVTLSGLNIDAQALYDAMIANDEDTLRDLLFSADTFTYTGDTGNDSFTGGDLVDLLTGGGGEDTLNGGGGGDTIRGGLGNDTLDGGDGSDWASYSGATAGVTVNLLLGQASGAHGNDTLSLFENIQGSNFDDVLTGDGGSNSFQGLLGNDTINGGLGLDAVFYSTAPGAVVVNLGGPAPHVTGAHGNDTLNGIEVVVGSDFNDTLTGSGGDDQLQGRNGGDTINGGGGADILFGQAGIDQLTGGAGFDQLVGGTENDTLRGGDDNDNLFGDAGDDQLFGDAGPDNVLGGAGNDLIEGGAGIDNLQGGLDNDTISGGDDPDSIFGEDGADTLDGDDGADILNGGAGVDILRGGEGGDSLDGGSLGADTLIGGSGHDSVNYGALGVAVTVNLTTGVTSEGDTLSEIEEVTGTNFGDTLTGNTSDNTFFAGVGNDTVNAAGGDDFVAGQDDNDILNGGDGNDFLSGDAGNDTIDGGIGDDELEGDEGDDTINGGDGTDDVSYSSEQLAIAVVLNGATNAIVTVGGVAQDTIRNIENVEGGDGNDQLTGDALANVFSGQEGDDTLNGGGGADTAVYDDKQADDDVVVVLNGATNVIVTVGGVAEDTIRNIENLIGGNGDDQFTGDNLANILQGEDGNDTLDGAGGNDTADYADKNDDVAVVLNGATNASVSVDGVVQDTIRNIENVNGGDGNDSLTGDGLANILNGAAGNDTLHGAGGNDTLNGGGGVDTASYAGNFGAVKVNLTTGTGQFNAAQGDTLSGIENIHGTEFNDIFTGNAGVNRLEGRGGDDMLHGAAGADTLVGGNGIDTADYAGNFGAVKINLATGTGQFNAAQGDILSQIENVNGTEFNDILTGSSGVNRLEGRGGNDVLHGGLGADTLVGGNGADTADYAGNAGAVRVDLVAGTGQWNAAQGDVLGTIENVTGTSNNDVLLGDNNANILHGGLGADSLTGRGGLDTADYTGNVGAVRVDLFAGTGQWNAAQGDTLSAIENVTGTSFNDVLLGDNNANVLNGGLGADSLTGRGGADSFLFSTALGASNVDTITDYNVAADTIQIDDAVFTQLGPPGTIGVARFRIGAAAGDSDDRIIYNSANGALSYDADGNGGGAAVQFATLSTGLALTNADFVVV